MYLDGSGMAWLVHYLLNDCVRSVLILGLSCRCQQGQKSFIKTDCLLDSLLGLRWIMCMQRKPWVLLKPPRLEPIRPNHFEVLLAIFIESLVVYLILVIRCYLILWSIKVTCGHWLFEGWLYQVLGVINRLQDLLSIWRRRTRRWTILNYLQLLAIDWFSLLVQVSGKVRSDMVVLSGDIILFIFGFLSTGVQLI